MRIPIVRLPVTHGRAFAPRVTKGRIIVRGKPARPIGRTRGGLVASLPPSQRRAFGNARRPEDAIWVPLLADERLFRATSAL